MNVPYGREGTQEKAGLVSMSLMLKGSDFMNKSRGRIQRYFNAKSLFQLFSQLYRSSSVFLKSKMLKDSDPKIRVSERIPAGKQCPWEKQDGGKGKFLCSAPLKPT